MVDIKEVAKKVIADEALAIQNLARFIDDDFEKVVRLIYNTKGRVDRKSTRLNSSHAR